MAALKAARRLQRYHNNLNNVDAVKKIKARICLKKIGGRRIVRRRRLVRHNDDGVIFQATSASSFLVWNEGYHDPDKERPVMSLKAPMRHDERSSDRTSSFTA